MENLKFRSSRKTEVNLIIEWLDSTEVCEDGPTKNRFSNGEPILILKLSA